MKILYQLNILNFTKIKNITSILIFLIVIVIISTEFILRTFYGFCNAPLYIEDKDFEYIYAPNQNVLRFGNQIIVNEYSMRSLQLSDNDSVRILFFGDLVVNGGSRIDHNNLSTSMLEKKLGKHLNDKIRVLNISAGSWGPDNAFAYLNKYGDFNSKVLVLFLSSHHAIDTMTHKKVVGIHPNYPKDQYAFAIIELIDRYIIPYLTSSKPTKFKKKSKTPVFLNRGIIEFINYAKKNNKELILYLHPTTEELIKGIYDKDGERIIKFIDSTNVKYILGINSENNLSYYSDYIHLNNDGQKYLSKLFYPLLKKAIASQNQ